MTSWFKQVWTWLRLWDVSWPKDEEYTTTSGDRYRPLYVAPEDGYDAVCKALRRDERLCFIYRHYDSLQRITTEQLRPILSPLDLQLVRLRYGDHLRLVAKIKPGTTPRLSEVNPAERALWMLFLGVIAVGFLVLIVPLIMFA